VYGNTYYYVLDCGLSTGGKPVSYTPGPNLVQNTPTIIPNTPNADGSIIHIVQHGDTLGSLSMAYNVPLVDLLKLNNFTLKSVIYINQKIVIRGAYTATPTLPTGTPTIRPTITEWPTIAPTITVKSPSPTQAQAPVLPISSAKWVVVSIVFTAMIIAGLIALLGTRKK
jgi:LysM repeat protein